MNNDMNELNVNNLYWCKLFSEYIINFPFGLFYISKIANKTIDFQTI